MSRVIDLTLDSDEETPASSDCTQPSANGLYSEHGKYIPTTSPNKRALQPSILDPRSAKRRQVEASHITTPVSVSVKTAFYHRFYPYIVARIRAYHSLTADARSKIGERAARELQKDDFLRQIDDYTLPSSICNGQIRVRAEKLVDKYVKEHHRVHNQAGATIHPQAPPPGSALASMKRTVTRPPPMTKFQRALAVADTRGMSRQSFPRNEASKHLPVAILSSSEDESLVQPSTNLSRTPSRSGKRKSAIKLQASQQGDRAIATSKNCDESSNKKSFPDDKTKSIKDVKSKLMDSESNSSDIVFSPNELAQILATLMPGMQIPRTNVRSTLQNLLKEAPSKLLPAMHRQIRKNIGSSNLKKWSDHSIMTLLTNPSMLDVAPYIPTGSPTARMEQLLVARSRYGDLLTGDGRKSVRSELKTLREDTLARRMEWSDCSGDLSSIAWTPANGFICGAVAHSDSHNQQYNKPGNLCFGAVSSTKLQSVCDHRIPRPVIESGDNALWSMRQSQDPWLYSSVTSISVGNGKIFTSSYDKTVKVWSIKGPSVKDKETSYSLLGTWPHAGNVNFVQISENRSQVATASDCATNAIRIYDMSSSPNVEVSDMPFATYSGNRADEQAAAREHENLDWSYHVATMAWGQSKTVQDLLLVGYSPRSSNPHDDSVPDDKVSTGELCLWDTIAQKELVIGSAKTQNTFEAVWHPSQPIFIVATSPCGNWDSRKTKTQIRLFRRSGHDSFSEMRTLDCSAMDINEITVRPNSKFDCYVTASCTSGSTFVWDTGHPDRLLHELKHGACIDELDPALPEEEADVGVKFSAWGNTVNRFYTGSSDGVVKVWDITAPDAFVRDVITLSGGVSAGAFSPDFEHLVLGDATGKVHLLSVGNEGCDDDNEEYHERKPIESKQLIRRRAPITPFSTSASSQMIDEHEGQQAARELLQLGQLVIHEEPYMGVVQGPNYASTGFFDIKSHKGQDPARRLNRNMRLQVESQQAEIVRKTAPMTFPIMSIPTPESSKSLHMQNCQLDADLCGLELEGLEIGVFGSSSNILGVEDIFRPDKDEMAENSNFEEFVDSTRDLFLELPSSAPAESQNLRQNPEPEPNAINFKIGVGQNMNNLSDCNKSELSVRKKDKNKIRTLEAIEAEYQVSRKPNENTSLKDWDILFSKPRRISSH